MTLVRFLAVLAILAALTPAPAEAADRGAAERAVCDGGLGARTPVLFVHGFVSSPDTWDQRGLALFCTTDTYPVLFDYEKGELAVGHRPRDRAGAGNQDQ